MIADFSTPAAPSGWLECDGAAVSRATFAALFAANTIQQTGSRTNSSAIITGLSSTTNMKVGYFVGGTGIPLGTLILNVDTANQITLNANASSTGSGTVIVSPWALGDGSTTFTLPDSKSSGRYRRSRTSTVQMGTVQASQNLTHTHPVSITSGGQSVDHTHSIALSGQTGNESADHNHQISVPVSTVNVASGGVGVSGTVVSQATGGASASHSHAWSGSGTSGLTSIGHTHFVSGNTTGGSADGTEARPISIVVITCVKT